jgi:diphosphomevalonate decarboxylase
MVVCVVSTKSKSVGSTEGMLRSAATSPYWRTWVDSAAGDVEEAMAAVGERDLPRLGEVMERSTFKMHATMHTSTPPLNYWQPATMAVLHEVEGLRGEGTGAWVTMDAGPQVKVLCSAEHAAVVSSRLAPHCVEVHVLRPGVGAHLVTP